MLSEETELLLKESLQKSLGNSRKRKIRERYPIPATVGMKTPKLDDLFTSAESKFTKDTEARAFEKDLVNTQGFLLDAARPLISMLEGAKSGNLSLTEVEEITKDALMLLANASSQISKVRRKRILKVCNPDLSGLVEKEELYTEAAPALFGGPICAEDEGESRGSKNSPPVTVPPYPATLQTTVFSREPPLSPPEKRRLQQPGYESVQPIQDYHRLPKEPTYKRTEVHLMEVLTEPQGATPLNKTIVHIKCVPLKEKLNLTIRSKLGWEVMTPGVPISPAGRVKLFTHNWEKITQDQWVLQSIQGVMIEFTTTPYQVIAPPKPVWTEEEWELLAKEVDSLLEKGAITELPMKEARSGFYSNMFLVPKKDGKVRPVINLKKLNQFVATHHFKMEGIHTVKDLIQPNDWMTKIDLKDAYFAIPVSHTHQKFLRFTIRNRLYQFNCLPFGLSSAPWIFTKILKPVAAKLRELYRHKNGNIPGRYIDNREQPRRDEYQHIDSDRYAGESGLHSSPGKIYDPTHPEGGVSGINDRLHLDATTGSNRENEDQSRSQKNMASRCSPISESNLQDGREDEHGGASHTSRSSLLQTPPGRPDISPGVQLSELRSSMPAIPGKQGRTPVVGRSLDTLEWQGPMHESKPGLDNRVRRFPYRMGCDVERYGHGRLVEYPREELAHKLLGTPGSLLSCENICQVKVKHTHPPATGQHHSCSICQSPGRNSVPPGNRVSEGALDVVPETEDHIEGTTPTRQGQCDCRQGVQNNEGQVRLDVEPNSLQSNTGDPSSSSRSVCISPIGATAPVLQLETRPSGTGNRCLPTGLVRPESIRQSTLESCRQGPSQDPATPECTNNVNSTSVAVTTMVPNTPRSLDRSPSTPPTGTRLDSGDRNRNHTRDSTKPSRVDYLQQRYSAEKISEPATRLLLAPWREKSSKS